MNVENAVYAYVHCRPDGRPFYVGKGRWRRARNLRERNSYHSNIVNKYGRENILVGKLECSSDDIAYDLEIGLIKCLRRSGVELCNYTAGGEGGPNPTEETRKRLSQAAKLRGITSKTRLASINARKGKPLPEKQRAKLKLAQTGKIFTEEHRKNISISAKKRGMSRAIIEAAKTSNIGRKWTDEQRRKMTETWRLKMLERNK